MTRLGAWRHGRRNPIAGLWAWLLLVLLAGGAATAEEVGGPREEYEFTYDWVSPDTDAWKQYLGGFASRDAVKALEIGSYEGRSAIWFLENILEGTSSEITCVDIFDTPDVEARFDRNIAASGLSHKVEKIKGDSREALQGMEPRSYDFVYIDGCHKASCVLSDAVYAYTLTRWNGYILFDDYGLTMDVPEKDRPKVAIDAFLEIYEDGLELLYKDPSLVIVKKILAIPTNRQK